MEAVAEAVAEDALSDEARGILEATSADATAIAADSQRRSAELQSPEDGTPAIAPEVVPDDDDEDWI